MEAHHCVSGSNTRRNNGERWIKKYDALDRSAIDLLGFNSQQKICWTKLLGKTVKVWGEGDGHSLTDGYLGH